MAQNHCRISHSLSLKISIFALRELPLVRRLLDQPYPPYSEELGA